MRCKYKTYFQFSKNIYTIYMANCLDETNILFFSRPKYKDKEFDKRFFNLIIPGFEKKLLFSLNMYCKNTD